MFRLFSVCLIGAGLSFSSFGYLAAKEADMKKTETEQKPEIKTEKQEPTSQGELKVISKLAKQFKVEEQAIVNLRMEGYGYGEISHALVVSEKSGKSLDEITALRNSGMGWGEIAKKYDLKLGTINAEAKKVEKSIKKDLPAKAMKGKSEKTAKPAKEKPGKMAEPVKSEMPMKPDMPMKSHK